MPDLIERDAAIKLIQPRVKPKTVYGEGYLNAIEHVTELLALMPSASSWIPCSERKPDDDSYNWAVGITSSGRCIAFQEHNAYENDTGGISVPTYLAHGSEITHWMPLQKTPQRKDDTHDND